MFHFVTNESKRRVFGSGLFEDVTLGNWKEQRLLYSHFKDDNENRPDGWKLLMIYNVLLYSYQKGDFEQPDTRAARLIVNIETAKRTSKSLLIKGQIWQNRIILKHRSDDLAFKCCSPSVRKHHIMMFH